MGAQGYRLGHRPALDGLRGAAVIAVVVEHTLPGQRGSSGTVGVTLFFVLSGFLITRLLLEENSRNGYLDLRRFWIRRGVRLMPALVVYLLTFAVAFAIAGAPLLPVVLAATYISNIAVALGLPLSVLAHTWSLAMEEQFYLVWPLILLLTLGRRRVLLAFTLGALFVATASWRWWLIGAGTDYARVAFAPDTRVDAIILGCLLAVAAPALLRWRRATSASAALGFGCLAWACQTDWLEYSPSLGLVALAAGAVVWWGATVDSGVVLRATSSWPMARVGMVSYGVYLWHDPLAHIIGSEVNSLWAVPLALASALVLAVLSWRCVEQPARRWATRRGEWGSVAREDGQCVPLRQTRSGAQGLNRTAGSWASEEGV